MVSLVGKGLPQGRLKRLIETLDTVRAPSFPIVYYSNLIGPKLFSRVLPRSRIQQLAVRNLVLLRKALDSFPDERLDDRFPALKWTVPIGLYMALIAKDLALHRFDIEKTGGDGDFDSDVATVVPEVLWAASTVYSRPAAGSSGVVRMVGAGRELSWLVQGGHIEPLSDSAPPDVTIAGRPLDLALCMVDRAPPDALSITGDVDLAKAFLFAFSFRAGPVPFFNY